MLRMVVLSLFLGSRLRRNNNSQKLWRYIAVLPNVHLAFYNSVLRLIFVTQPPTQQKIYSRNSTSNSSYQKRLCKPAWACVSKQSITILSESFHDYLPNQILSLTEREKIDRNTYRCCLFDWLMILNTQQKESDAKNVQRVTRYRAFHC